MSADGSKTLADNNPVTETPDTTTEKDNSPALDEQQVADFLTRNPEFFNRHKDVLASLDIPHESGGAISLLEKQVEVLRDNTREHQQRVEQFIANARENDQLFEKTRLVILDLLASNSIKELSDTVSEKLRKDFKATACKLVFASSNEQSESAQLTLLPLDSTRKTLGELFEKKRGYCGELSEEQSQLFFPEFEQGLPSGAIIPIHLHRDNETRARVGSVPGIPLLVIGSEKPDHFSSDHDTLFLDFIGEVMATHMNHLADKAIPGASQDEVSS